jgi:uncharacterized membrane protein
MEIAGRIINALFSLHPLHSMVVHFPIGLTGAALLFILLALWQRNEDLEKAAFFTIALAAVATVVAAITGYRDNIIRFDGDAPLVNVKIFLGVSLFILTTITALSRRRQPQILWNPTTMVLYLAAFFASFSLAIVLGFIGGVILYGI